MRAIPILVTLALLAVPAALATRPVHKCVGEYGTLVTACATVDPLAPRAARVGACVLWAPCASLAAGAGGVALCTGLSPMGPPLCLPEMLPLPLP